MSDFHPDPIVRKFGARPGRVQSFPRGESKTRQSEKDSADIRRIYAKYKKTGVIDHLNHRVPQYGDFSMASDLLSSLNRVEAAKETFGRLPSSVRKAADHSPVKLLEMLATEDGRALLQDAGMDTGYVPPSSPQSQSEPEASGPDLPATPSEPLGAAEPTDG